MHWWTGSLGMWIVEKIAGESNAAGECCTTILHLDTIVRAAHLLPVFGRQTVSWTLSFMDTLDTFTKFYINKYTNHHAFETAF